MDPAGNEKGPRQGASAATAEENITNADDLINTSKPEASLRLGYHFTVVPDSVIDDPRLGPYSKLTYLILARFANRSSEAFPSITTIAKKGNVSGTTVKGALRELHDLGFIAKEPRRKEETQAQTSNLYTLQAPSVTPQAQCAPPLDATRLPPQAQCVYEVDTLEEDTRKEEEASSLSIFLSELQEERGIRLESNAATREVFDRLLPLGLADPDYFWYVFNQPRVKMNIPFMVASLRAGDYEAAYIAERKAQKEAAEKARRHDELQARYTSQDRNEVVTAGGEEEAIEQGYSRLPPALRMEVLKEVVDGDSF